MAASSQSRASYEVQIEVPLVISMSMLSKRTVRSTVGFWIDSATKIESGWSRFSVKIYQSN